MIDAHISPLQFSYSYPAETFATIFVCSLDFARKRLLNFFFGWKKEIIKLKTCACIILFDMPSDIFYYILGNKKVKFV